MLTDIWSAAYILRRPDAGAADLGDDGAACRCEHGNVEESAYGYVTHAITVGPVRGDYAAGLCLRAARAGGEPALRRRAPARQDPPAVPCPREPVVPAACHLRRLCARGLPQRAGQRRLPLRRLRRRHRALGGHAGHAGPGAVRARPRAQRRADREAEEPRLRRLGAPDPELGARAAGPHCRAAVAHRCKLRRGGLSRRATRDSPFFAGIHAVVRLQLCVLLGSPAAGAAGGAATPPR